MGSNPLNFGQAAPGTIEQASPIAAPPAPQTRDLFGVPWEALGAHIMGGSQNGITAAPVDAGIVKFKNMVSPTPQNQWRTGEQIMGDYWDMGLNLAPKDRVSPEAESYMLQQAADRKYRQSLIDGSDEKHPLWNKGGGFIGGFFDPIMTIPALLTGGESAVGTRAFSALGSRLGAKSLAASRVGAFLGQRAPGLLGNEFVGAAATNAGYAAGGELVAQPFRQTAGIEDTTPQDQLQEVGTAAIFGAAIHGVVQGSLLGLKNGAKLAAKEPRIAAALQRVQEKKAAQTLAGAEPTPEANLAKELEPHMPSLGQVMNTIDDHYKPVVEDLTPDESSVTNEPEVVNPTAPPEGPQTVYSNGEPQLPKDLSQSKPNYNYGQKRFADGGVKFDSDVDQALFIVAQKSPSKRDADFMSFLRDVFPDKKDADIRYLGSRLRDEVIKPSAKATDHGAELKVEKSYTKLLEADRQTRAVETSLAHDPAVELITTPEERAVLKAETPEELVGQAGEQVRRIRENVLEFGQSVHDRLTKGELIEPDDVAFKKLRNSANGALTSLKRQLGDSITPENAELLKDLQKIVKQISGKDENEVQAAMKSLSDLDDKLVKSNVITPDDLKTQIENSRAALAKAEGALQRSTKPETIAKWEKTINSLKADLSGLQKKVTDLGAAPEGTNFGEQAGSSADLQTLADQLGIKDKIDNQL